MTMRKAEDFLFLFLCDLTVCPRMLASEVLGGKSC